MSGGTLLVWIMDNARPAAAEQRPAKRAGAVCVQTPAAAVRLHGNNYKAHYAKGARLQQLHRALTASLLPWMMIFTGLAGARTVAWMLLTAALLRGRSGCAR
jgi:hypothetical protein